ISLKAVTLAKVEDRPDHSATVACLLEQDTGAFKMPDAGVKVGAVALHHAQQKFRTSVISRIAMLLRLAGKKFHFLYCVFEGKVAALPALEEFCAAVVEFGRRFLFRQDGAGSAHRYPLNMKSIKTGFIDCNGVAQFCLY